MATMPHCDQQVLHAPGECEYCDAYPTWQEARRMWGIAFTGRPPTEEQPLPCPSEVRRDVDTINRWPGNRPSNRPSNRSGRPKIPPTDDGILARPAEPSTEPAALTFPSVEDWWSAHSPTQLGRPNIPVLRRDLEGWVRRIVEDILREERNR